MNGTILKCECGKEAEDFTQRWKTPMCRECLGETITHEWDWFGVDLDKGTRGPCCKGTRFPVAQLLVELADGRTSLNDLGRHFNQDAEIFKKALRWAAKVIEGHPTTEGKIEALDAPRPRAPIEERGIRSYEMPPERGHLRCQQLTDDPDEAINAWKEALKEHRFKSKMQANTVLEEAEASDDERLEEIGSWLAGDHQEDCGCGLCESFQSWCKAERK